MRWLTALALIAVLGDGTETRIVSVAPGEDLQVTIAGEGTPVVLIPGFMGGAFGFRKLIPLLASHHQVIVIEPIGIGTSARPERADYSLGAQADRVAAVMDTLGLRGVTLVAHSLGAGIAFRVAYRRPDLVGALVSIEGGPTERAATPGIRRAAEWAPWVKFLGGVNLVRRKIHESFVKASGDTSWVSDEVVVGYTEGAARDLDGTLKAYLRMAESREREKLEPHVPEIHCAVRLLIGGAKHPESLSERDMRVLATLPNFTVDTVAGAGHHLHEERPEVVAAAVEVMAAGALAAAVP
jgi:pimeloyl-ACP methyl ester carboxylesterase